MTDGQKVFSGVMVLVIAFVAAIDERFFRGIIAAGLCLGTLVLPMLYFKVERYLANISDRLNFLLEQGKQEDIIQRLDWLLEQRDNG